MSNYPGQGYYGSEHHGGQRGYNQQQGYQQGSNQSYRPPQQGHHGGGYGGPGGYGGGGYQEGSQGGSQYGRPPPAYSPPSGGIDSHGHPVAQSAPYAARHSRSGPPPPSGAQQFGHGAPEGYTFQYSNCTGKRKALLIGINYFGQKGELRGCINDVQNLSAFLIERYGYRREDMVVLTDDQPNPVMQPTKANIVRAMEWLVKNAQPNDALFLHYSGHGGQTEDLDGDEDDGYDEVIYPVDYTRAGHIVDDEIHFRVVKPLQAGVRLTAIFDSCHSGSVMDLPYLYSTKGVLKEPNLAKEAGQGLLDAFSAYTSGNIVGVASSVFKFAKTAYKGDAAYTKTKDTRTSPADVIVWSGSKDDQTS